MKSQLNLSTSIEWASPFEESIVALITNIDDEYITINGQKIYSNSKVNGIISNKTISQNNSILHLNDHLDIFVGDILHLGPKRARVIFSIHSKTNSIFATVRCNSNCLMCSQPPLEHDDLDENLAIWDTAIDYMPDKVEYIGVTGGEPTLLGSRLTLLLNKLTNKYPDINIDILSNGRRLSSSFKVELYQIQSPGSIKWCIPIYSDVDYVHDYIVQGDNAFWQTTRGLSQVYSTGFQTEIRVVLHSLSLNRLEQLAKYITLNYPYVHHVALMGLENIGYTLYHNKLLTIENYDVYIYKVSKAITILKNFNLNVSLYNIPLCHVPEELRKYCRQSISEWKNSYPPDCQSCSLKKDCAGFFTWNLKLNPIVYPI
jgi:His-Xaa-Ser system radical SAM maturase HxsC